MAARRRMSAVKGAVLSLLLDAYQRRDKVGLITFRGAAAQSCCCRRPPRSRPPRARLAALPAGGRTPLAAGLRRGRRGARAPSGCATPAAAPLLVLVTDGRATGGADAGGGRAAEPPPGWPRARSPAWWWTARPARSGSGWRPAGRGAGRAVLRLADARRGPLDELGPRARVCGAGARHDAAARRRWPDAAGKAAHRPRRRADHPAAAQARPLLIVHTGDDEGQVDRRLRAGAAGLERRAGRSACSSSSRAPSGRSARRRRCARSAGCTPQTGEGGPVDWHKMGEGWSWLAAARQRGRPRRGRPRGLGADQARSRRPGLPLLRARRVHLPDEVGLGRRRRGGRPPWPPGPASQHVVITGRDADPRLVEAADLVAEMTKVKHPMDAGQKGQRGIEW